MQPDTTRLLEMTPDEQEAADRDAALLDIARRMIATCSGEISPEASTVAVHGRRGGSG